ncbi:MAG: aminopeptidase P family protein [Elusimicrobium sp.]|jgi:Xaa-Pro aminopeptidase|nr:aminopeptidase P family protein [Elusimicrobium sp.]
MADKKIDAQILKNFQKQLSKNKIGAYIVTDHIDQLYLAGFSFLSMEAAFLITPREMFCFTRDLYIKQINTFCPFMNAECSLNYAASAAQKAGKMKLKNVCFDAAKTSYLDGKIFDAAGFKPSVFTPAKMREVKTAAEIKTMRRVGQIVFDICGHIKKFIKTGMTEIEVAAEIDRYMKGWGVTSSNYPTIVCFGVNSNNAHHIPTDTKLKDEMPVLTDFVCLYKGYFSDITRSWWHGKKPTEEYKKVWNIVNAARAAGVKAAKPGITGKELDLTARDIITAAGYGKYFIHRTGHGIGMEPHENPCAQSNNTEKFVENNVVTIEPGIYLPGKFGIRLEDTVVISKTGGLILTKP